MKKIILTILLFCVWSVVFNYAGISDVYAQSVYPSASGRDFSDVAIENASDIPPIPVTLSWEGRHMTYTNVSLNGGGNSLIIDPGKDVNISFDWQLKVDSGNIYCPGCIVQFYYGIKDILSNCFFNGMASPGFQQGGKVSNISFKAPLNPGIYYITQTLSLQYSCKPDPSQQPNDFMNALAVIVVSGSTL